MNFESQLLQHLRRKYVKALDYQTKLDEAENYINNHVKRFEEGMRVFIPVSRGEIQVNYNIPGEEFFAKIIINDNKLAFKRKVGSIEVCIDVGEESELKILDSILPSSNEICVSRLGGYLNDCRFDSYLKKAFEKIINA
ncbi:hypothetical protein [Bacillus sp. 37MA]|uniref:hypothetical protein n=1 Tax=Bacillus sp. 37MA TaxID=1132442 RepID=UPI0003631939|nr:hypothetical protein [Bacillus sp. 37MA]